MVGFLAVALRSLPLSRRDAARIIERVAAAS
jgi:hypothetical protein